MLQLRRRLDAEQFRDLADNSECCSIFLCGHGPLIEIFESPQGLADFFFAIELRGGLEFFSCFSDIVIDLTFADVDIMLFRK